MKKLQVFSSKIHGMLILLLFPSDKYGENKVNLNFVAVMFLINTVDPSKPEQIFTEL